ncbi:DnaJ C-terminal domain-containing protein [Stutzerimonas kirkiae]|uniref:DNA-binding protein n=1 Tax=Stutzerimonas kirkiae TaxID=2211392 RepID=A0A4Q9RDZ1_9GAMM|nr:DnaJ C-terminal domain-containing protein [Stutzerimonas kirkiae]TBU99780.1 DNA-binding protein [Stutzerimonas kirkiae]TBV05288.1 DNA-binding protein [Stutzerimonas kirkiae]TBV11722.1 DNA-binding protein [Stutzerimonas kirkiae]TBV15349.1 DNA-binding protein [Stutzerimonas kirkiae]
MEFKDYYAILGVDEQADAKTIKSAYRKLAHRYHPDVSKEQNAEERFKEVAEAYEVLKDPEKRSEYDHLRRHGSAQDSFQPPPGWQSSSSFNDGGTVFEGDFSDFFESLFGARQASAGNRPRPGRDIELELPVFLEELLASQPKPISYPLPGNQSRTLNVTLPKGVGDGERIRLKGQGAPGREGAPAGDLYLTIRLVPHPLFDVDGHDLILTVPLAPWEAALGARITIPTLGGQLLLNVPANSQNGQRLRLKGKGLPTKETAGDLYAVLRIVMPKASDEQAQALWRQLQQQSPFDPRANWSVRQ